MRIGDQFRLMDGQIVTFAGYRGKGGGFFEHAYGWSPDRTEEELKLDRSKKYWWISQSEINDLLFEGKPLSPIKSRKVSLRPVCP